jgi:uncharacterized circularly permuted ATP-grasp superfamily protein/uncharacterized alpha-E superfamily protein
MARSYSAGAHDEMLAPDGAVREAWGDIASLLGRAGPGGLAARDAHARKLVADDGVGYRPPGGDAEQPWALDPVPLMLGADEWAGLEAGVAQRAELLDRLLSDLYGPRLTLRTGLLPPEVVLGHEGYVRGWARAPGAPPRRELFLAGTDLARTPDGWYVVGDRVQAPSGAGYAMANRRVVARVLAAVHRQSRIARLRPFFDAVRRGLEELIPDRVPRIVLLTPGPQSETAFEQAFLSSELGFPLVLGSELQVRDGRVWQRTLGRLEPVDVILRRVDAAWCDPLDLRQGSHLGVPGLVEAARLGTVVVVNGLGSGVAENPGLLPFLPALADALLDEPLALPVAPTWWCGDPVGRSHVIARMPELLIKPIARAEGRITLIGAELTSDQRTAVAARIEAEPHAWVGQEQLFPSTVPVIGPGGGLDARPFSLRTFAVAEGGRFHVLTGGIAQAAAEPGDGRPLLKMGAGTVSKDVWVLGSRPITRPMPPTAPPATAGVLSARVAADLFWLGRYAERAEGTARLLRAVADRWADFQTTPDRAGGHALATLLRATTAVTQTAPGFHADPGPELLSLLTDRSRPGTLAYAVHRLTGAAQAVREQLPTDTWFVLSRLEGVLRELAADATDISGALSRVLEGLLALAGLAAESHVRDAGWCLLDAGRRVERAQNVTALLASTLCEPPAPTAADDLVVESVLITAESIITHRRRHRSGIDSVLELLLVDRANPRAVGHQLERLRADAAAIPGPDGGVDTALAALELRLAAADPVALARRGPDGTRDELRALLTGLNHDLLWFAEVLERGRFAPGLPPRPLGMAV